MVNVYDVHPNELIERTAGELKNSEDMQPPEWAYFVKTGVHKERVPADEDWWFIRSAAVLRSVYKYGPIGVSKLRKKYGGRKNMGVASDRTFMGSGNILRKILQQLEKLGYIKQAQKGVYKGRVITPEGRSFLDKLATEIYFEHNKEKKAKPKKEEKKASEPKEKKTEAKKPAADKKEKQEKEKPEEKKPKKSEKKEESPKKPEAAKDESKKEEPAPKKEGKEKEVSDEKDTKKPKDETAEPKEEEKPKDKKVSEDK